LSAWESWTSVATIHDELKIDCAESLPIESPAW
jgi:hypothetical protein